MDMIKAEVRGNRGLRRKQRIRLAKAIKKYLVLPPNPTKHQVGKLVTTRKACDCFSCKRQDHSKSISSLKAEEAMLGQMEDACTAQ